jgi:hypothetical protein
MIANDAVASQILKYDHEYRWNILHRSEDYIFFAKLYS